MTKDNIVIDLTGDRPRRYSVNVCYFCPDHPNGKPILPEDRNAYRNSDNQWVCGTCAVANTLSLFGGRAKKE